MREFKVSASSITDRGDECVERYLRDISRYEMVSPEKEAELARDIRKGGRRAEIAKQRLIEANLRFVVSVAKQYQNRSVSLSDLISDGNIGLIKAAQAFDETRGFKFISYAVWWIRQSIVNSLQEYSQSIRLPMNRQKILSDYRSMDADMMQLEQRHITIEEFCEVSNTPKETVADVINTTLATIGMDSPVSNEDSETSVGDTMASESMTDDTLDRESLHDDVERVLGNCLKPREADILCRCFGLGREEESIENIARDYDMSRERIRQISVDAVEAISKSRYSSILRKYLNR